MTPGLLAVFFVFWLFAASCLCRIAALADARAELMRNQFALAERRRSGTSGGAAAARLRGETHVRYYHGGVGDLQKEQFLLPPAITHADIGGRSIHRRNRVYVTTDAHAAFFYAACSPSFVSAVYEVEPEDLTPDPDCNAAGRSFECARARIVRVVQVLTNGERQQTMARLAAGLEIGL